MMNSTQEAANNLTRLIVCEGFFSSLHQGTKSAMWYVFHFNEYEVIRFEDL